MSKIQINLLPIELRSVNTQNQKKALFLNLSILWLVIVIVLSVGVLSFRFIQNTRIQNSDEKISEAKEKVNQYKTQEQLVLVLKQRLQGINTVVSQDAGQAQAFNLITLLTPAQIRITSFSIDKSGNVVLQGEASSLVVLKDLFDNLTDPRKNEGKIVSSKVEALNKGTNDRIRFDLTIQLAGGKKPV